jgi:exo-beta-1,3-glucanase (GH17 family)
MSKPKDNITMLMVNRYLLKRRSMLSDNTAELETLMASILKNKIHGLSFSPYLEGQDPNDEVELTPDQIAMRLEIIRPYTDWVRVFSSTHGNEMIPAIAKQQGFKTMVGAWLNEDKEANETELKNAIYLAETGKVDLLAVGNEVMLREDMEVEELIEYIRRVKAAVPGIPVGYVDAYYTFVNYPELVDEVDVIFANCYPFWEYCALEISVDYMAKMYDFVKANANGKPVIISETGWPTKGEQYGGALPSYDNAMRYFIQTQTWAQENNIPLFYFSSFDEIWKMNHEGEYGAYWGLWDKDGIYKFKKNTK